MTNAQDDSMRNHFTISPMSVDEITLKHKYSYDQTSDNAHIIVSFELQFPPSFPSTELALNHPLLDISNIDSFPETIEDDKVLALERLYHLISQDIYLTCRPEYTRVLLTWDAPLGWRFSLRDVIDSMTESETESILCQVDIPYPPDVLEIAFETRKSTPIVLRHTPLYDGKNTQWIEQTFILKKPTADEFEPLSIEAIPHPVRIWKSTSNVLNDVDGFEFGVVLTSQPSFINSLGIALYIAIPYNTDFSISDVISCRSHHEQEYGQSMPLGYALDLQEDTNVFRSFGKTCRIKFLDTVQPSAVTIGSALYDMTASTYGRGIEYTGCNRMHKCQIVPDFHYFPTRMFHTSPHPTPIPFELMAEPYIDDSNDGHIETSFLTTTMNVHYILTPDNDPSVYQLLDLVLIFHDLIDISDVTPKYSWETSDMAQITAIFEQQISATQHSMIPEIEYIGGRFTSQLGIENITNQLDVPCHGCAINRPTIRIPLNMKFRQSTTFQLTVKIPMNRNYDIDSSRIYAILLPQPLSQTSVFSSNFGLITPIRTTSLRDYSYRCLPWRTLIDAYIPIASKALPISSFHTVSCPSHISPETGTIDVQDTTFWKSRIVGDISPTCFFELSAVCVTPSVTQDGAYDIHPVTECPSLLGQVHGVPCEHGKGSDLDEGEPLIDIIYFDFHNNGDLTLTLIPNYVFKMSTPFQIRFFTDETSDDDGKIDKHVSPWITIAHNIPLYLDHFSEIILSKPFFHHKAKRFQVKVIVPGAIGGIEEFESAVEDLPQRNDDGEHSCKEISHQVLDPIHLVCVCAPGFTSDVPIGLDNPFIHPKDFTCTSLCDDTAGYTWNAEAKQCETDTGRVQCGHGGAFNPSTQRCDCFDGFFGSLCSDSLYDSAVACQQQECVEDHVYIVDAQPCFIVKYADHNQPPYTPCNCLPRFTGDRCQHERVCGDQPCVNGNLASASGLGDDCICHCNPHSSGDKCDECALPCENGGVGDESCSQCICPVGYIGATCETPVWIHSFTLDALPKHILDLIAQEGRDVLNPLNQIQHHIVEALFNDYSDAIADGHIILGYQDGQQADEAKSIVLKVTASPLRGVVSDEDPTASRLSIDIMVYPDALTPEQLAYIKLHLLEVDWTPITSQLVSFKKTLVELGIFTDADDAQAALPTISDPLCLSTMCGEEEEEEDKSSNGASILLTLTSSILFILSMPLIVAQVLWGI